MRRQVFPSGLQGTPRPSKLHTIEKLGVSKWSLHFLNWPLWNILESCGYDMLIHLLVLPY